MEFPLSSSFTFLRHQRILMMMTTKKNEVDDDNTGVPEQTLNSNSSLSLALPHDLILYEIVTRIPIDSLGKFRCVCKSWSTLIIKDPVFVSLHSRRNYNPGFIMLSSQYIECNFKDDEMNEEEDEEMFFEETGLVFFDPAKKEKRVSRFRQETGLINEDLEIEHSVSGLVLISCLELLNTPSYSLHVYNPVTGCSIKLPPVINEYVYEDVDCLINLAYDGITEKYKVVCCGYHEKKREYYCRIVTVGTSDSWRDVVFPQDCHLPGDSSWKTVFANGCLHWLINVPGRRNFDLSMVNVDSQREILSFDVSRESFYTIQFPKEASEASTIHEMEGTVGYIDYLSGTKLKLWVLKDNNPQQQQYEWIEKCSFDKPPLFTDSFWWDFGCMAVVTYPKVKMAYYSYHDRDEHHEFPFFKVCCYDVESKEEETIFEDSSDRGVAWHWHVNSLLSIESSSLSRI